MVTVGFSTSSGLVSRLVRWVTRSKASHSWICLEVYGLSVIVHASLGGVRMLPRDRFEHGNTIVGEYRVKPDVSEGVNHTLSFLGEKYDYLGLFGFLKVELWKRWFHKKVRNPWASAKSLVCSELIVHLAHAGKIPEWEGFDPESVTPAELMAECERRLSFEKINGPNSN